jgi:hypothetical protein
MNKSKVIQYTEHKGQTGYWAVCPMCWGAGKLLAEYIDDWPRYEPCAEWCVEGKFFIQEDIEDD